VSGLKRFDRKFGTQLLRELPEAPAVYLFKDERGRVLYAGKAKNIRRRLQSYRNASRRKAHRKMRALVREASSLEVKLQPSECDALLLENRLIRELRPQYNVDGAYAFLYPAIGAAVRGHQALFAFTTRTEAWSGLGLEWYGVFRSRRRARDAFEALAGLLGLVGHAEPRARLPQHPRLRGSCLVGFRRLERDLLDSIRRFLAGESSDALVGLAERLLEQPSARREAAQVQEDLQRLEAFYASDLVALRRALRAGGLTRHFVAQDERDALFLATR
jgi:excinuclease UvrABC nuclease subunit